MLSSLAFLGCQPQRPQVRSPGLAGAGRVAGPKLFPQAAQAQSEGRGWLVACAAVAASILRKRGRDPERPKRPMSAFFFFLNDSRSKKKDLATTELSKEASEEWSTMTEAKKKPYKAKASKAKAAFDKAWKKYVDSGRAEMWKRDPNRPKQPLTPFLLFLKKNKYRPSAEAAVAWKDLAASKKKPFVTQYEKSKAKYDKDMEEYKASGSEEAWKGKVGIKALEDKEAERKRLEKEKEKEKLQAHRDREKKKAMALKEKASKLREKEKQKAVKERMKAKAKAEKEKLRVKALKEKEKAKLKVQKEREKAKALKTVRKTAVKKAKETVTG